MAMSNSSRLLLLNKDEVEALLQPDMALQAVREAFVLHSQGKGRVFPVVRERLDTGGIFGIKSGDVQEQGLLGFKAAGFWPDNGRLGSESHQATILLFDPATGRPSCVIDGNAVTTMRTGAAGALGLVRLARADSTQLCVFGTGVQARAQLNFSLRMMPTLSMVRYITRDGRVDESFEAQFATRCAISLATDCNSAVAASDVVITATPGSGALFDLESVQPGTHLNCVGTDTRGKRELPDGLLQRVRLFVDDATQARQIGETQWAPELTCISLGDLLARKAHYNRRSDDITLFDMTGLALQDLTVARALQERADATQTGTRVAWPW